MRPDHRSVLAAALMVILVPACAEQASAPSDPGAPQLATRIESNNNWFDFSLPDVDKALGGKKGRWHAEAEKAVDAATGR